MTERLPIPRGVAWARDDALDAARASKKILREIFEGNLDHATVMKRLGIVLGKLSEIEVLMLTMKKEKEK